MGGVGPPGFSSGGGQDRVEVVDPEPACEAGETEGLVNACAVRCCAQLDCLGHRRFDLACPDSGGLNQPCFGAFADGEERFLVPVRRLRLPVGRVFAFRIVSINDRRLPGVNDQVSCDLGWPVVANVDDHQHVARQAHPHPAVAEGVGDRIAGPTELDRRGPRHAPRFTKRDRVGLLGDPMQLGLFLSEHVDRTAAGDRVDTVVDLVHERHTRRLEGFPRVVFVAEVRLRRDQVGLRDLDGRLRAALRFGIERDTRRDCHPVIHRRGDDLRVPNRQRRDMTFGHRLFVVSQRIGRGATQQPERPIQRPDDRR